MFHKNVSRKSIVIRKEKPIIGTNFGISVKGNWKALPPFLHELKANDCSIHKAKYWEDWTSMYIKTPKTITFESIEQMTTVTDDALSIPQKLPFNTTIYIYNISTVPYTVLDFGCYDRVGLLCEILEVLSKYDIDVKGAYVNTIGNVVSNIFYITHKNNKLDADYIEYLKNSLELQILQENSY